MSEDRYAAYRSGSTEPWTASVIGALIYAKRPKVVVETGTFEGKTTRIIHDALCQVGRDFGNGALFVTIESDPERYEMMRAEISAYTNDVGNIGIEFWQAEAIAALKKMGPESVDFIFLDDDHLMPHVADEMVEVKRVLRPGGICVVHDCVGAFGLGHLIRRLGGIVLDFPRLHPAGGLGVWTK